MIKTLLRPVARLVRRLTGTAALTESQTALAGKLTELERMIRAGAARSDGAAGELLAALPDLRQRLDDLRDRSAAVATVNELVRARAEWLSATAAQAEGAWAASVDDLRQAVRHGFDEVLRATHVQAEASQTEIHAATDAVARSAEATRAELRETFGAAFGSLARTLEDLQAAVRLTVDEAGSVRNEVTNTRLGLDLRLGAIHNELLALGPVGGAVGRAVEDLTHLRREFADLGLDRWKVQELEGLVRYLRRRAYEDDVAAGRLAIPELHTEHPIALDTDDTAHPRGALNDNSICYRFNQKLPRLFPDRPRLAVLDLGCAGGGFVRSLIDDGHFAVGIDGSDTPQRLRLGEWGTIPHHLHTCDITRPFALRDRATGTPLRFDVITAWEVLEHIREEDLPAMLRNVTDHLAPGGLFFCSVATFHDEVPEVGAVYHHTVQPRDWWVPVLARLGFEVVTQTVITDDDWVRGAGNCRYDYRAEAEGLGFHLVLRRRTESQGAAAA